MFGIYRSILYFLQWRNEHCISGKIAISFLYFHGQSFILSLVSFRLFARHEITLRCGKLDYIIPRFQPTAKVRKQHSGIKHAERKESVNKIENILLAGRIKNRYLTNRLSGFEILNNATLIYKEWLVFRLFTNIFHYLNFSEEY